MASLSARAKNKIGLVIGLPVASYFQSKTGGPGECAPNRGSHGQTVRVDRSVVELPIYCRVGMLKTTTFANCLYCLLV